MVSCASLPGARWHLAVLALLAASKAHLFALLALVAVAAARPGISRAEWAALRQLFNDTGGAAGHWANATGWDVVEYESAPAPCDGRSWFGIYDWRGYAGHGVGVAACTEQGPATGWHIQISQACRLHLRHWTDGEKWEKRGHGQKSLSAGPCRLTLKWRSRLRPSMC